MELREAVGTDTSRGAQLTDDGLARPLMLLWQYRARDGGAVAEMSLRTLTDFMTNLDDPRCGVISYAFARTRREGGADGRGAHNSTTELHFLEVFADPISFSSHIASDNEGNAFDQMLSDPSVFGAARSVAVDAPQGQDSILAALGFGAGSKFLSSLDGFVVNTTALAQRPETSKVASIELWLEPLADDAGERSAILDALRPIVHDNSSTRITSVVFDMWHTNDVPWLKPRDPDHQFEALPPVPPSAFSSRAIVVVMTDVASSFVHLDGSAVAKLCAASAKQSVVYTSADWSDAVHDEAIAALNSVGLHVQETRELVAGFLLHPAFAQDWEGTPPAVPRLVAPVGDSKAAGRLPPALNPYFTMRYHDVTGILEAVVFDANAAAAVPTVKEGGVVTAAVMHVANRLCNVGRKDKEIAAGTLFGQLARLRKLQEDVAVYNAATDDELENNLLLADRCLDLFQQFAIFYADIPTNRRVPLALAGVAELIEALEYAYDTIITDARVAVDEGEEATIQYMGLQELYAIGQLVTTTTVGGLGPGVDVVLRIQDIRYDPFRSLFGGRKFSLSVTVQCMVAIGGEFLPATHNFILDEWVGGHKIKELDFLPVPNNDISRLASPVRARLTAIASLGRCPTYCRYAKDCFFPHTRTGGGVERK